MATYFVYSGAGGANTGADWTNAYTTFGAAVTAASTDGDIIKVHKTHQEELGADTTYTFTAGIEVIVFVVDKDASDALSVMGTGGWIGNSTTNRGIILTGAGGGGNVYGYGLTLRTAGSTADSIQISDSDGSDWTLEEPYIWHGNSSASSVIRLGSTTGTAETFVRLINPTFRFGATGQSIQLGAGRQQIEGGSISAAGSAPTTLLTATGSSSTCEWTGGDLSLITGTLVANLSSTHKRFIFAQCKLGSGVTVMAAQTTTPNKSSAEVYIYDCASGDEHYHLQHHNAQGSLTTDTGIYANDGASYNAANAKASWKIVTTANASFYNPYISPWITVHHEGTSAITPYLEICRSGSATAYQNNEVWSEFLVKVSSGFTLGAISSSDRMTPVGTPADQTTGSLGAGDWTGENATAWFGKLSPTATVTPAELGDLCARVCVAEPSSTVYVDPKPRGLS